MDSLLLETLEEIKTEDRIPAEKFKVVESVIDSQGKAPWADYSSYIGSLLCNNIAQKKKVMPSNQYEDVLVSLNKSLNSESVLKNLREKFKAMCGDSIYIDQLNFRICTRMCENLQLIVMQEMRVADSVPPTISHSAPTITELEKEAFSEHMTKLLRTYYFKIVCMPGPVWTTRALCVRREFVEGPDGTVSSTADIADWVKNVHVSANALKFCIDVEEIVRSVFKQNKQVTLDLVLHEISSTPQLTLISDWHVLTAEYFSEQDSFTFMRDVVSMITNLSIRLEEKLLQNKESHKRALPKFALRSSLKRN